MKNKIVEYITSHFFYQRLRNKLQNTHFGTHSKVSLYAFVIIFWKKLIHNNINSKASSVAFSLTLSLFPFILFSLTLLPYTPIEQTQVLDFLKNALPKGIFDFVNMTVQDIMSNKRQDLLSISFILGVYAATSGMAALIESFNSTFRYAEKRSFFKLRLIALYLMFLVAFVFLFAILTLVVSTIMLNALVELGWIQDSVFYYGILILKYLVVFFVFFLVVSLIYYVAPAIKKRWRFFSMGSLVASVLIIIVTNGFSYYLDHFASYNKLYGSIGTVIALMFWIYLLAFILMLGFEINASIMEATRVTQAHNRRITPMVEKE
jgi:membrane protein